MSDGRYVLDASALLAFFHRETGCEEIMKCLMDGECIMSSVNYAEVVGKCVELNRDPNEVRRSFLDLDITLVPLDENIAFEAGLLKSRTRQWGFSLGDRVCLALAREYAAQALTTEQTWRNVGPEYRALVVR